MILDTKIRSLTELEFRTLKNALTTLKTTSTVSSTAHWGASVMLDNDAEFLKKLLWIEKGALNG
jgi:hypothetical protein